MRRVILDTDIASLSLKAGYRPQLPPRLIGRQVGIAFVTLGELTKWAELRQWGPRQRQLLAGWLNGVAVLPRASEVTWTWGRISAAAARRGRPRPQNDTWIAASCPTHGFPLATSNLKDFADFAQHEGLVLLSPAPTSTLLPTALSLDSVPVLRGARATPRRTWPLSGARVIMVGWRFRSR